MRVLAIILLTAGAAVGQDVDLQIRPEAIYVENIGGNIVPMERVFFHIVLENKSGAPIEIQWLRFDMVNSQGVVLSGQYSAKALMSLFDSAINRKRIEPTPKETLVLASGQRKAISDIFMDFPVGFIGENLMLEVDYKSGGTDALRKASTRLKRAEGFLGRLPFESVWYVAAEHGFGFAQAIPCGKLRIRFHSNWSQWQEFQAGRQNQQRLLRLWPESPCGKRRHCCLRA